MRSPHEIWELVIVALIAAVVLGVLRHMARKYGEGGGAW